MTKQKILVVDDEKPLAMALKLKLTNSGYNVKAVFNGKEAIDSLEKEVFDLILLDLVMPQMDGFQVLEEFSKKEMPGKIVVTSNLSQEEDEQKAKSMGAIHYFVKSDTPLAEIVKFIGKALQKPLSKKTWTI
ncbi:MAG: response regulator [Candidatus Peregrinibacteria bacterium]|nr:response regulator [Candidatus Peregrinibacteria bacterium]